MDAHIPTMFMVIIITSLVLSAAISVVAFQRDRRLLTWAIALGLHALGYILIGARGEIPNWISVVVANILLATTLSLFVRGLLEFQGRELPVWLVWGPVVITGLGAVIYQTNFGMRAVIVGTCFLFQLAHMLVLLVQKRKETSGRGQVILASGVVLAIAVIIMRSVAMVMGIAATESVAAGNVIQTVSYITNIIFPLLLALGLVMMTKELAESQLIDLNQKLVDLNATLEEHVIARTAELATARAEAEGANAVKTRFMTNVSHEMRTPLQSILGYSMIGRQQVLSNDREELADYFEQIVKSGERMQSLVESLILLAQQAWDKQATVDADALVDIDLGALLKECESSMHAAATQREQRIVIEHGASAAKVRGDSGRLRQSIEYLVGNALRYSPAGSLVTLRTRNETRPARRGGDAPGVRLVLDVIDEGCGIPAQEINAIFEPFYESSRTASGAGGTGLGLPLSRAIVERHKGTLRAINRPEGGAIFELSLPVPLPED